MWLYGENANNGDGGIFKAAAAANMVDLEKNPLRQICRGDNSVQICRSGFFSKSTMFAAAAALKRPLGRPVFTKQPYSIRDWKGSEVFFVI